MNMIQAEINNKVWDIVAKLLETEITQDTELDDAGLDSIKFISLVIELEDYFQIEIPDTALRIGEMNTIAKITQIIYGVLNDEVLDKE